MTSTSSLLSPSNEKSNGTKLSRLIVDGGTTALRNLFNLKVPPNTLATTLNSNHAYFLNLKNNKKIFQEQWEKLYPSVGQPNAETFDITLLSLLLREICGLTPPSTGWHNEPLASDPSQEANLVRIKRYRNQIYGHVSSTGVSDAEFEGLWKGIAGTLEALGIDKKDIDDLKTKPLDPESAFRYVEELKAWCKEEIREVEDRMAVKFQMFREEVSKLVKGESKGVGIITALLPDCPQNLQSRGEEEMQIGQYFESKHTAVVLITGGPGFGKTSLATKFSHKLNDSGTEKIVFYQSLISSDPNVDSLAREMRFLVGDLDVFANPDPCDDHKQAFLKWCREMKKAVIFVLDNADEIIASRMNDSSRFLVEIRRHSQRLIQFLVTSRIEFQSPNMEIKILTLRRLPREGSINVVLTHAAVPHDLSRADLDTVANLCGDVPLALCLASSLLSKGYRVELLIAKLKEAPLDTLQNDRYPSDYKVREAINVSYEHLSPELKKAFVRLSAIGNPIFTSSATTVLESDEFQSMNTLTALVARSLIEKCRGDGYEMHPLIQTFALETGVRDMPEVTERARQKLSFETMSIRNREIALMIMRHGDYLADQFGSDTNQIPKSICSIF